MKKIPSLFMRNYIADHLYLVRDEIVPGSEWVIAGEGVATRKYDGTCCMWMHEKLWKRYELKDGRKAPLDFLPAQEPDPLTGNVPGWVPVSVGRGDRWHMEALLSSGGLRDGTYELCGPKIQKNPEGFSKHVLIRHGSDILEDV